MLKVRVDYPSKAEEREILDRMTGSRLPTVSHVSDTREIIRAREAVTHVYIDDRIKDYIVNIVHATRVPAEYNLDIAPLVQYGASPRATVFLTMASKAHAFLRGRGYVTPEDVKAIGLDVLRHRVIPTYEAEAEEVSPEALVARVFDAVEVP
jgi:MoxR-like ATPase